MLAPAGVEIAPQIEYPDDWERVGVPIDEAANVSCFAADSELRQLLNEALESNLAIRSLLSQVEEARLGVVVARAGRLPSLSASLSGLRQKSNGIGGANVNNRFSLGVDAQYEVDVWLRLSAVQQRAQLLYRATQYDYENTQRQVLAGVANAWYTAIFARELAGVFAQRVESIGNNLEIIEQGYEQGINSALDVYLARTSFAQEKSRLARQQQTVLENTGALQLLLTEYPGGDKGLADTLPAYAGDYKLVPPASLVERRPDVQQAWVQLLAQDAAVAIAHKQRLPRFSMSAGIDEVGSELSDVFDGDNLLWSALASVAQPVFQAGRLKALEAQSRERLAQAELAYIDRLQNAFGEVEDAISNKHALSQQIDASTQALDAATAAYELSFQQYQRGLVNYTTVLQSEQRAFDATSNLLELRYRQLINRVDLCTAFGGEGDTQ